MCRALTCLSIHHIVPVFMSPSLALSCHQVSKHYGSLQALQDFSLDVPQSEIFALLGPNGAGKSTLIHSITGLAIPSNGHIEVFGHDTQKDYRAARRLVGLMPQEVAIDPFFTPIETITNQMGFMGIKPSRDRAEELLATFHLSDHKHAYLRELSGGMKRRLLIAKALAHYPKLLFLDEPTAGVDIELRKDLWKEVVRLRDTGTTVFLTTHYLEEAEQLADRIGFIQGGKLLRCDRKSDLMAKFPGKSMDDIYLEIMHESPDKLQQGATS